MEPFRLLAPAKINLSLKVVGRREDGYHLLDSIVAFAKAGDFLDFAPASDLRLTLGGPMAAPLVNERDNLVLKAARALQARLGIDAGAHIHLVKNLPVQSGIGGGSSDAATALIGLSRLWNARLAPDEMEDLARSLGADAPVCLFRRAARMQGAGEILIPLPPLPDVALLLVNPGVGLSTPAVFRARDAAFSSPGDQIGFSAKDARALADLLASFGDNDLAPPAIRLAPVIKEVLERLDALAGRLLTRMSGSGATCFALFETGAEAKEAADRLRTQRPEWWIKNTVFLDSVQS